MSKPLRVLMLEDNPSDAELALRELRHAGFEPTSLRVETERDFLAALDLAPDLILADYVLPYFDGLRALDLLTERKLGIPFILLSGSIGDELAVEAIKKGADDYLLKDRMARLGPAVVQALERKQVEAAARKSEHQISALVTSLDDIIIEMDEQGTYLNIWTGNETLLTRPKAEMLGRRASEVVGEELADQILEASRRVLDSGKFEDIEYSLEVVGGRRWFLARISRIAVPDGAARTFCLLIRDITERKQAEEAIRESEMKYRIVADNTHGWEWWTDAEENFIYCSPSCERVTGFPSEKFMGDATFLEQIIHPDDLPGYQRHSREVIEFSAAGMTEFRVLHQDGGWRWIEHVCQPIFDEGGHFLGIRGSNRDITERKRAEERIQRQLEHLTALSAIDRVISSNFDLRLSLGEILTFVTKELGVDAADILILDTATQMLEFTAGTGFHSRDVERTRLRFGEGQAGLAALERRIIQIPDVAAGGVAFGQPELLEAEHVAAYFAVPLINKGQINSVLEVFHRAALKPDAEWIDFLNTLAGQVAIAIENSTLFEKFQRSNLELTLAYDATIEGWSHALDLRDKETEGHTQRVTEMTLKLARTFGFSEPELMQVHWGALLHDIGKMGVPDDILLKPGPLTDEEWLVMKKHPDFAYEMLSPIRYLRQALDIPYCHHEKWDGSGYPHGLKGEQIPLTARIFAVVDVWDALMSDRPYRKAWTKEKAREHILTGSGTHFDPQVVDAFLKLAN